MLGDAPNNAARAWQRRVEAGQPRLRAPAASGSLISRVLDPSAYWPPGRTNSPRKSLRRGSVRAINARNNGTGRSIHDGLFDLATMCGGSNASRWCCASSSGTPRRRPAQRAGVEDHPSDNRSTTPSPPRVWRDAIPSETERMRCFVNSPARLERAASRRANRDSRRASAARLLASSRCLRCNRDVPAHRCIALAYAPKRRSDGLAHAMWFVLDRDSP